MSKENSLFCGYIVSLVCLFGPGLVLLIIGGVNLAAYDNSNYQDWKFVTNCTIINTTVKDKQCTIKAFQRISELLTFQIEYLKNNQTNQTVEATSPKLVKKKCDDYNPGDITDCNYNPEKTTQAAPRDVWEDLISDRNYWKKVGLPLTIVGALIGASSLMTMLAMFLSASKEERKSWCSGEGGCCFIVSC